MATITPQTINQEMENRLKAARLDFHLPSQWYVTVLFSLRFASLLNIGLRAQEFKEVVEKLQDEKELNCFEFATLNNHRENRTYSEFKDLYSFEEFVEMQVNFEQYEILWNEQVNPIKENLMAEMITNSSKPAANNMMRAIPE